MNNEQPKNIDANVSADAVIEFHNVHKWFGDLHVLQEETETGHPHAEKRVDLELV